MTPTENCNVADYLMAWRDVALLWQVETFEEGLVVSDYAKMFVKKEPKLHPGIWEWGVTKFWTNRYQQVGHFDFVYYIALYFFALYCNLIYCFVSYCDVPHCIALSCFDVYCTLKCIVLCCILLYLLCCFAPYYMVLIVVLYGIVHVGLFCLLLP